MTFTGTLIEDLMATVERAEQSYIACAAATSIESGMVESGMIETISAEHIAVEPIAVEAWFASVHKDGDYETRILGVA
jgi:hypothetical protein